MKKVIAAGSAIALAALPMAGVFAAGAATDDLVITDTLQITVEDTCTFSTTTAFDTATQTATQDGNINDTTYAATVTNGAIAAFTSGNTHKFGIVCNDTDGWQVTASAPADLAAPGVSGHVIDYKAQALPVANSQTEGQWNASVTGANVSASLSGIVNVSDVNYISDAGGVIAKQQASTDGSTFTVTYGAYVGTQTPAGTYTATSSTGDGQANTTTNIEANDGGGTIDYILAALQ